MTAQGKIKITLGNTDGTSQVYLGQANSLVLTLANQSGATLPLTGGTPQNPPPSGGAFAITLSFAALYATATDQQHLTITAPGWNTAYVAGTYPAWVLTPAQDQQWTDQSPYSFDVGGLTPTAALGSYYVSAGLYNLDGLPPQPANLLLGIANAPAGGKDLSLYMDTSLASTTVDITRNAAQPNTTQLTLTLFNKSSSVPLAPNQPWVAQPTFTLSFVSDVAPPGYFALTTPDALNALVVSTQKSGWKVTKTAASPAQWRLEPTAGNQTILGTGTDGIVQFTIANIITQFAPGPTLMYLQYNNMPGYNDGIITLLLLKSYPPMQIAQFVAGQYAFNVQNEEPLVSYLNWSVVNANYVELSGFGQVAAQQANFAVPVTTNVTYVLTAYDLMLGNVQSSKLEIKVSPSLSQRWTPIGSITTWSGDATDLPAGWVVCDGTNGAPDLRSFFVLGAGTTTPRQSDALPMHTHALNGFSATPTTTANGGHSHAMPTNWYNRGLSCGVHTSIDTNGEYSSSTQFQGVTDHTHTLAVSFPAVLTGANTSAPRPAWYALLYIIYRP